MNTRERFVGTLTGQEVDRIPFMKVFGGNFAFVLEQASFASYRYFMERLREVVMTTAPEG